MKKQLAKLLFELGIDVDYFYAITVYRHSISLQGEYNEKLIKQLQKDEWWEKKKIDAFHVFRRNDFEVSIEEESK